MPHLVTSSFPYVILLTRLVSRSAFGAELHTIPANILPLRWRWEATNVGGLVDGTRKFMTD